MSSESADVSPLAPPVEFGTGFPRAGEIFLPLKQSRPEVYHRWVRLTRALLESLPLGLPLPSLRVLVELDLGIELSPDEVMRFEGIVTALYDVAYELRSFLSDDAAQ